MRRSDVPSFRESALVAALFCGWTWLQFGPVLDWGLAGRIGPDIGDPVLNLYFLKWAAHQIELGLPDLWNAPFFYPTSSVLTLSDHLLVPGAALLALGRLGVPAVAAYNLLLLGCFAGSAWSAWWVARRSGLSAVAAAITGAAFSFSSFHWSELSHLQVLRIQWVPVLLWSFDRLLEQPRPRRAAAFLLFYAVHIGGGAYLAVILHVGLLLLLLNRWREALGSLRKIRTAPILAAAALASAGTAWLLYAPYVGSSSEARHLRIFSEVRHYSSTLLAFLEPSRRGIVSALIPDWPPHGARATLFPGIAATLLVAIALHSAWKRYGTPVQRQDNGARAALFAGPLLVLLGLMAADRVTLGEARATRLLPAWLTGHGYRGPLWTVALGLLATALALRHLHAGRWLRWNDLPHWPRGLALCGVAGVALSLPLFFWVPWSAFAPFRAMRVPWRFAALAAFPLALAAGWGFEQLMVSSKESRRRRLFAPLVAALLVVESVALLPKWSPLPEARDLPPYADWLARQAEVTAYVELPLPDGPHLHREAGRMYLQSEHWKPLGNGFSAAIPNSYRALATIFRPLPSAIGVAELRRGGYSHMVVHWQEFLDPEVVGVARRLTLRKMGRARATWERSVASAGVQRRFEDDGTVVYALGSPGVGTSGR